MTFLGSFGVAIGKITHQGPPDGLEMAFQHARCLPWLLEIAACTPWMQIRYSTAVLARQEREGGFTSAGHSAALIARGAMRASSALRINFFAREP